MTNQTKSTSLKKTQLKMDVYYHLKATGLVLPSPNTRDSVMSMLSERIIGTMCLKRDEGDGVPTIYYHKEKRTSELK